jgi:glycosyltransferase involved in cell wall biosynthesis
MQKVLVNARFLTQRITGVQRYAHEIIQEMDSTPHPAQTLELISPRLRNPGRTAYQNTSIRQTGCLQGHPWEQLELPTHTRQHLLWSPCNSGPITSPKQIVTIHDAAALDHPEWFSPAFARWYQFLLPQLLKRARHIITDSNHSKERLLQHSHIADSNITVIPGGVHARFHRASRSEIEAVRAKFSLPANFFLYLGSLEPRKNLARLLQAWENINQQISNTFLVIIGETYKSFRTWQTVNIPANTRFLGYAADEYLPALYSAALAFVFPALYEGFGLPPLEAMACGTPVITSNTTSIPEVVGQAAWLVNPYQSQEIQEAMLAIALKPTLRDDYSQRGPAQAQRFPWSAATNKLGRVFEQFG